MRNRPNPRIKKDMFDAIRKDAMLGVSRDRLSRRYRISRDTIRRVVRASGWKEWTDKLEQKRARYYERKKQAAAESCPDKTGDSGLFSGTMGARAMEEAAVEEAAVDPITPVIVDEYHKYRPLVLTMSGLPPEVCDRVHYLSTCPEAVDIIARAVILCPESIQTIINALYFPINGKMVID